jgi:hypothetical protein
MTEGAGWRSVDLDDMFAAAGIAAGRALAAIGTRS